MSTEEIFMESPVTHRYVRECSLYALPGIREYEIIHKITPLREDQFSAITNVVLEYQGISLNKVISKSRERHLVYTRQLCFYFLRKFTQLGLAYIGDKFGGRDHTTVMYGVSVINDLIYSDESVKNDVRKLSFRVKNYKG